MQFFLFSVANFFLSKISLGCEKYPIAGNKLSVSIPYTDYSETLPKIVMMMCMHKNIKHTEPRNT